MRYSVVFGFSKGTAVLNLWPYQAAMINRVRDYFSASKKSVLLQAPTGAGKTVMAAHILAGAVAKKQNVWMLVHRRELIEQVCDAVRRTGTPYWVAAARWERFTDETPGQGIMVGSIGTISRRVKLNPVRHDEPTLCVWDECHHVAANTWSELFKAFPSCRHIGLTATPIRGDGSGLGRWFSSMVEGPTTRDLITLGALAPYRLLAPPGVNLNGIKIRAGEYVASESEKAVSVITGDVVRHYQQHAPGKQALIFCVTLKHSMEVVAAFQAAGIHAEHVDGGTKDSERRKKVNAFRNGTLRVLSNVDLFGEGVDLPAVDVLIMLRPTMSLPLYLQQVGRVLRAAPGKTALILDHVGNVQRHDLPDSKREWSLETPMDKKKQTRLLRVKVCPKCFSAQAPAKVCRYCGYAWVLESNREIQTVDGELVEVVKPAAPKNYSQDYFKRLFLAKGMPTLMAEALAKKQFIRQENKS